MESKKFRNTVTRIFRILLGITLVLSIFTLALYRTPVNIYYPVRVLAQTVFELSCPAGTQSVQALQTTDVPTGKLRQNYCVDNSGNVFQNITGGILSLSQFNGDFYVGTAIGFWSGADVCAQIQSAYNALASLGGNINIVTGNYSCTTQMSLLTSTKNIGLRGSVIGAVTITYTPTTGTLLAIGGGPSNAGGVVIENIQFLGSGNANSTIGIQLATNTVAMVGALLKNVGIGNTPGASNGFGTGLQFNATNVFLAEVINPHIIGNTTGVVIAGEGNKFEGGLIGTNVTGVSCTAAGGGQTTFSQTSFDNNSTVAVSVAAQNCQFTFSPGHFENAGGGTQQYLTQTAGSTTFLGGDGFQDDGGTAGQFATVSGGIIRYETSLCKASGTLTQAFNLSGNTTAILKPHILNTSVCAPASIGPLFTTTATGLLIADPVTGNNATNNPIVRGSNPFMPQLTGTEGSGSCWTWQESGGVLFALDCTSIANRFAVLRGTGIQLQGTIQNFSGAVMGTTLKKGSGSGNYTNATTSYTVVDSSNLCFTVTIPTGWKLGIAASGAIGTATGVALANLAITDNAACSTANSGILVETTETTTAAAVLQPVNLNWTITGDGASHNVALQFKTSNAADAATLLNSSATQLPTMVFTLMPSN